MATTTRWTANRCLVAATLAGGLWLAGIGCGSSDSQVVQAPTPPPTYLPRPTYRPNPFSSAGLQYDMNRQQAQLAAQAGYRPPVRQVPRYVPVPPRYTQPYNGPMTYDPTVRRLVPAPTQIPADDDRGTGGYFGGVRPPAGALGGGYDATPTADYTADQQTIDYGGDQYTTPPDYTNFGSNDGTYDI